ncbi:MAG: prepilin-type N-terminal cleavage/methylation domain-containing protein [Pusillimonas sp.]
MSAERRSQSGFTLIEVLVALVLMALVSLVSWRGLDAVQKTGERLDERAEGILSMVRALGQIERDLLLHAGPDVLPGHAGTRLAGARAGTMQMPAGIHWDAETGLSVVRSAGNGRWQQLRWYLDDGVLYRATGMASYQLPLPPVDAGVAVLGAIEAMTFRIWQPGLGWRDPSQQENARSVRAAGDAEVTGLEIALFRSGVSSDQPFRKVVLLP